MPNVSVAIAPFRDMNQATIGSAAPAAAGTVELRIGDGIGHAEARAALHVLLARFRADALKG